jgi:hypothetical protein
VVETDDKLQGWLFTVPTASGKVGRSLSHVIKSLICRSLSVWFSDMEERTAISDQAYIRFCSGGRMYLSVDNEQCPVSLCSFPLVSTETTPHCNGKNLASSSSLGGWQAALIAALHDETKGIASG